MRAAAIRSCCCTVDPAWAITSTPCRSVLSPPYRVVSYNQRGCGPSTCDGTFEVEKQVADLDAIRTHVGAGRIHIFGHSWGGLLGQLYAKAHPKHVASLVLCCSMGNTGSRVAAMESRGIAERVMAKPKRSQLAWAVGGMLMQFPGKLGDLGFGLAVKQLLPNYVVRPERAPKRFNIYYSSKRRGAAPTGLSRRSATITWEHCHWTHRC